MKGLSSGAGEHTLEAYLELEGSKKGVRSVSIGSVRAHKPIIRSSNSGLLDPVQCFGVFREHRVLLRVAEIGDDLGIGLDKHVVGAE